MSWGAWGAVCYPLLFAACNILLLPGGILAVGGGFFFGLWWGFFIVLVGNLDCYSNFLCVKPMDRQTMVSAETFT
jgi:hypothetical protein